jgi:hypothetical protein
MARASAEATAVARHMNGFLGGLSSSRGNRSGHTLKSYGDALTLYARIPGDRQGRRTATPQLGMLRA